MTVEDGKTLVRRHFDEVLNARSLSAVDEIYSDEVMFHGPQGVVVGKPAIKTWVTMMHQAFEEFRTEIEFLVAEDDRVVAKVTSRGFHCHPFHGMPATNRRISIPMTIIFRLENDRIVELENIYDARVITETLGTPLPLMQKL